MAPFSQDPEEWQRLDWMLLQNSAVALYYRRSVLEGDINWFTSNGYQVVTVDAGELTVADDLLAELGKAFAFPDYYGENLAAFNDCLSDVEVPDAGGLVLVMHRFDHVAQLDRSFAQIVLHICADNSRRFLLTGRRFLVLIQSDDARLAFEPVGRTPVIWNPQEWLDANRGL